MTYETWKELMNKVDSTLYSYMSGMHDGGFNTIERETCLLDTEAQLLEYMMSQRLVDILARQEQFLNSFTVEEIVQEVRRIVLKTLI